VVKPRTRIGPDGLVQNNSVEKPKATVGIIKGTLMRASNTLTHFEPLLVMNHAMGSPASKSRDAVINAIENDQNIAPFALAISGSSFRTVGTRSSLREIPRTGGRRMKKMRKMTALE
jgi:hypothetical protein